jgi:hypothetical protein
MKRITLLAVIFLFTTCLTFGQVGFRPGFIIKNNGDSLTGLVFYSTDPQFSKTCRFKRFQIAQDFEYNADQLRGFGFKNGRYFESKGKAGKKAFYECLLKGRLSVFVESGKRRGAIYLEHASVGFFTLSEGSNLLPDAGSFKDYIETIRHFMDLTGTEQDLNQKSPEFDAVEIAHYIKVHEVQKGQTPREFQPTEKVTYLTDYSVTHNKPMLKFGFNAGYQFLTIDIPGTTYTKYFDKAQYNATYRPFFGLYINRKLLPKSDILSAELGLNYVSDTYYGYAEYTYGHIHRDDITLKSSFIQVPLFLKVALGKGKVRPFIKLGAYTSCLLGESYHRYSEVEDDNEIYTDNYYDYTMKADNGLLGGLGFQMNLGLARVFTLDAGYIYGNQKLVLKEKSGDAPSIFDSRINMSGFWVSASINL